ncbi:phosphoenolpyruvate synthase [Candidatus Kaiserbacteria bacterium]|nr:phosphoenolpyruvate synthase [Candidatus Kaiserbacteria bacterium]
MKYILWMKDIGMDDVKQVGGKNASLGELIRAVVPKGVRVPQGFCVTADAYYYFLKTTGLDSFIEETLAGLDTKNLSELARRGKLIREKIRGAAVPLDLEKAILEAYGEMEKEYGRSVDVAVRSSATAEDLPGASFAGEHETYLGIRGGKEVVRATVWAMASLFTDRAISYRADKGFANTKVALSVGVQKMVRSDRGASGVMFTVDTESGFRDVVLINAVWGLGEMIVQGRVTPDEYLVLKSKIDKVPCPVIGKTLGVKTRKMIYAEGKPRRKSDFLRGQQGLKQTKVVSTSAAEQASFVLSEKEIEELARWGALIEEHYSERAKTWTPMDMEWAKDGTTGELHIVQARPETVQAGRDFSKFIEYRVSGAGKELVRGISVGSKAATGAVHVIASTKQIKEFKQGEILVTTMTDPDWEPIMKMAAAIITDRGGRTSHAAIVSRELGLPAIVGAGNATRVLKTGTLVTIDTTGSAGIVTAGKAKIAMREHSIGSLPKTRTHIMVNIASPDIAFEQSFLPVAGVGLAREEFIIASTIGVHPLAVLAYRKQPAKLREAIAKRAAGWKNPVDFYVDTLAYGIAKIGAAFAPRPVIVRFSDFKTNEYATLLGGEAYEPKEENPMIGWRGASRYYDAKFKAAFELECRALVKVREAMGLANVISMIPFCRTIKEAEEVLAIMADNGLVARSVAKGGQKTTPVYMMCEIPSNILLAEEFLDLFDGMSIGSNDLTQLTLGLDRDSGIVTHIGDENDEAVRALISQIIRKCSARKKYLGICGQGPSDLPDFAEFLVREGIESMSLNPDSVVKTIEHVAQIEESLPKLNFGSDYRSLTSEHR